jgi:murein DD-endopeptidase MepM/ murein hydrolase activator NlpD
VKGANPILTAALAVLILTSLLVPAIAMRSAPLSRPSLPVSTDADTALYGIVIPEEEQPTPASRTDLSRLNSLAMASYTIRRGETISEIARKLKLNLDTLISFNGIQDVRSLSVGTSLEYPNSDGLKYTVRRGDTLNKIAKSFSAPMEGILDWNGLTTSVITVGQQLFIPGARMNPNDINRILGMLFLFPVRGDISSRFGNRPDPFTGIVRFHNGVDITNKLDTPITAAMAGKVGAVGFNPNYGRFVIINHPGTGYQTLYGHLDKILVSKGENVKQGEPIGKLGDTGYSTGPHLHFSIFKNNEPVDPLRYLK